MESGGLPTEQEQGRREQKHPPAIGQEGPPGPGQQGTGRQVGQVAGQAHPQATDDQGQVRQPGRLIEVNGDLSGQMDQPDHGQDVHQDQGPRNRPGLAQRQDPGRQGIDHPAPAVGGNIHLDPHVSDLLAIPFVRRERRQGIAVEKLTVLPLVIQGHGMDPFIQHHSTPLRQDKSPRIKTAHGQTGQHHGHDDPGCHPFGSVEHD
ncbi:MAG: hypothetical protein R2787_06855 [Saprospiraceae bacterium]